MLKRTAMTSSGARNLGVSKPLGYETLQIAPVHAMSSR